MATTTAKGKKENVKSLNKSLVNATMATINTTIEHGEKWQVLTKKLVKKSEPVRRKQMDMFFDTAASVKKQVNSGKERTMELVGYDGETMERAFEYVSKTPVGKKVLKVTEDIKEKVTENPMVKKVEETAENLKAKSTAKFNDLKEDVLGQAKKVINKGEEFVDEALKQGKSNVTKAKKTVKAKATKTSKKAVAQAQTAKKTVAKVTEEVKATAKDDLKLIKGIGPKLEQLFNENGIETFAQLAKASEAKIKSILEKAGPVFKSVNFSNWVKEAQERA
ncbi:hypothetical protein [Flagellimonas sp.]|uniref:hypothetical protein n=1 Tax=Flagellimonas sp. TaxID=2058762 RepID=UPI003F49BFFB